MSEGISHCEIAQQISYGGPIKIWRPRPPAAPSLPTDGPRTREEMIAAYQASQARIKAAGQRLVDERNAAIRRERRIEQERLEAVRQEQEARRAAALAEQAARMEAANLEGLLAQVKRPSILKIIAEVAKVFDVTPLDLLSHRRSRGGDAGPDVVTPRQVVMYLAKVTTPRTLPEIAKALGNRDHTTVLWGIRKITALMAVDDEFRAKVEALRTRLTPP